MTILVTGASGRLGSTLVSLLLADNRHKLVSWTGPSGSAPVTATSRPVELTDTKAVAEALEEANPDALIHAGAISSADAVHRDPAGAHAVNVVATRRLAAWAAARGRRFVFTSTDMVFDGDRAWNREDDPARPILAYGRSKWEAEEEVLSVGDGLVARLSLLYGPNPSGRPGFFDLAIEALRRGEPRTFFQDEFRTPLDYRTAAMALIRLVESDVDGIIHVGGRERLSRFELMRRAASALGIDSQLVVPASQTDARLHEPRPADTSLDTSRLARVAVDLIRPSIEAALETGRVAGRAADR